MINWIRPCGTPLTTNDLKATVEHCESKGWKREEVEEVKIKRTRRNKEQMAADKAAEQNH